MAAILLIKANFILVGFISKNHGRHHSSCHLYWFCFTTLHFNCDYLHCSAKERVSKYLPLVVEAFLSIRLIEEEHHALEWLKSLLFFVLVSFSMIPNQSMHYFIHITVKFSDFDKSQYIYIKILLHFPSISVGCSR